MIGLLLYVVALLQLTAAVNVTVDLGYARYRGKDIGNGVTRWAGMRYARSVSRVDGLRFTAPQEPIEEPNKVTTDASKVSVHQSLLGLWLLTVIVWTSLHRHPERPQSGVWQQMVGRLSLCQRLRTLEGHQYQQAPGVCFHPRRWLQYERQCEL